MGWFPPEWGRFPKHPGPCLPYWTPVDGQTERAVCHPWKIYPGQGTKCMPSGGGARFKYRFAP